jgi:hypothetical protein
MGLAVGQQRSLGMKAEDSHGALDLEACFDDGLADLSHDQLRDLSARVVQGRRRPDEGIGAFDG